MCVVCEAFVLETPVLVSHTYPRWSCGFVVITINVPSMVDSLVVVMWNISGMQRFQVTTDIPATYEVVGENDCQLEVWTLIHKPSKVNCLFYTVDVPKAIRHYDPLVLRPKSRWYIHPSNQPSFLTVFTLKWWWDYKWYSSTAEGVNRFKTFGHCLIHSSTDEIVKQKASSMVWQ